VRGLPVNDLANLPTNTSNEEENNTPPPPVELAHDEKINDDLNTLTRALGLHFNSFGSYPVNISALVPQYLEAVPRRENGSHYDYTVLDQGDDFRFLIIFDGSQNPNTIGQYQFTKLGLSVYDPEEEEEEEVNVLPPPPPPPPPPGNDTDVDQDELTIEEEMLYGTDPDDDDTDNDGYLDGIELVNLYDPISSGEVLQNSGLVATFINSQFGYRLLYPSTWVAEGFAGDLGRLIIAADSESGDMINIVAEEYTGDLSIAERLEAIRLAFPEDYENIVTTTFGQADLAAWQTIDQQKLIYINDNYSFLISYSVPLGSDPSFATTFQMILNSFELIDVE